MPEKGKTTISIDTSTIIRVFLIALGFFLIYYLSDLVLVILTSIVIASFVGSAASRMKKFYLNRIMSVVLIYLISISALAGLFYLFAPLLITEIYNFSSFLSSYLPDSNFLNFFQNEAFSGAKDVVVSLSEDLSISTLLSSSKAFMANVSGGFFQTLSATFGSIFNATMIVVISFYLSIQENGIESFLRIVTPQKHESYVVHLWERTQRKIALWVKGQMLLGLLVAVLIYLVLSLLGVQYAFLLALLTGLMEMVPYGMVIAMVPAVSFGYLSGGLTDGAMVAGAFFIIHQFEVYLLAPLIVKRVIGLSPLVVILAVLIGYNLAGLWGFILAVPAAVVLMEILNDLEKDKTLTRTSNEAK